MITIDIPLRTARGLNSREHHFQRWQRTRKEKFAVEYFLRSKGRNKPNLPCVVLLTRVAPSDGLDSDNLQGALKSVRDAVADWLGVDDKLAHIVRYEYLQKRGPEWGVRIEWMEGEPNAR